MSRFKQGALLIPLALIVLFFALPRMTLDNYPEATVTKTFVKNDVYLVYTDVGTFEVSDTLAYFRWNSSDVWGKFKVGETYNITATGWRIGVFSWYENIVEYK